MKAKKQEFTRPWVGIVKIVTGDKMAKLVSQDTIRDGDKTKPKLFANNSDEVKIALADFPKAAQRVVKPGMKEGKSFRVRLNADCDEVENVTPVTGSFRAKAKSLGPKNKDGDYSLIDKVFNEGKDDENSHQEFFCLYEFSDGPFRGVEATPYYLHYKFEEVPEGDEDEGMTQFNTADTPQAKQLHRLQDWAHVHGDILDEPIRWPEDGIILETLEERVLDSDRDVVLVIDKGYITAVQPFEDYGDDEDDDPDGVDEAFPPDEEVEEVPAKSKKTEKASASKTKKLSKKSSDDGDDDL